jgi:hypothetical protein
MSLVGQALAPSPNPYAKWLQATGWSPTTVGLSFILVVLTFSFPEIGVPEWMVKHGKSMEHMEHSQTTNGWFGATSHFGKSDCTRSPEEEDDTVKLGDSICLACPALLHRLTGHVRCSSPAQFTKKLWEKPGVNSDLALTSHFSAQGKKVQKLRMLESRDDITSTEVFSWPQICVYSPSSAHL